MQVHVFRGPGREFGVTRDIWGPTYRCVFPLKTCSRRFLLSREARFFSSPFQNRTTLIVYAPALSAFSIATLIGIMLSLVRQIRPCKL